mgnify:CR=1 FL=1
MIDTKSGIIEPPTVVVDCLERSVEVIGGPGRVIGAPDCGVDTHAGLRTSESEIAWAKLKSPVEGARLVIQRVGTSAGGPIIAE